jgi:acetyl-CoA C-acetyltransferase
VALDPRTPVLVGAGQVTNGPAGPSPLPEGVEPPEPGVEPVELMAVAVRAALADCGPTAGRRLAADLGSLRVVRPLSWTYIDAATPLADRLGVTPRQVAQSAIGGNSPQTIASATARAIAAGELDVAIVAGAECMASRAAHRRAHAGAEPPWTVQDPATSPPVALAQDRSPVTDEELRAGLLQPIHVYPLFEQAIRAAAGRTPAEHQEVIAGLWARFAAVAAQNPWAWDRRGWRPAELATPGPGNRMLALPYPKRLVAYDRVDQAGAFVLCSVEAARAAGVPEERWVFPLSGADAHDHWFVSDRADLGRSPAIAAAGSAALDAAGLGIDDVAHVDLYSCFPCAVEMGAAALGLPVDDPDRPLTVTGGLTFFGGPINDYATHAIVQMAWRLREQPGTVGLVTALGWYATKHAVGLFSTRPPAGGFRWSDVQAEVDALPTCPRAEGYVGPATIETYTVTYSREGAPERGIAALRTPGGQRTWASTDEPSALTELVAADALGRRAAVDDDRRLHLA